VPGHDLVLVQFHRTARVVDETGDVGSEEVLAVAESHDERRIAARGHDHAGVIGMFGQDGEGTLESCGGQLQRLGEVMFGHG
jgi:hypothetical protein